MGLIVQKFGGTSLATEESRNKVIDKIQEAKKAGHDVVVVVSAMGRYGSPYATDTLLDLVDAKKAQIDMQEMDLLISTGEIISSVVMSNLLNKKGTKAKALTGGGAGVLTNDHHLSADVLHIDTQNIMKLLSAGVTPVVAGFQGRGPNHEITTIGRGGSDTTAALFGEALDAELVEIYTDVDGIMTTDPRVTNDAKILKQVSYDEVFQMAESGAKVIHPRAVEIARRSGVKMVIRNTFSDEAGTSITQYNPINKSYSIDEMLITSIAHRLNRVQVQVEGQMDDEVFFAHLAKDAISIDIINIFPGRRVFTIDSDKKEATEKVIGQYPVIAHFIEDCCKVTVIGERMTGVPGVMAKIVHALVSQDIEILQTADSLSTIACLIHSKDLDKAVKTLHKAFDLEEK